MSHGISLPHHFSTNPVRVFWDNDVGNFRDTKFSQVIVDWTVQELVEAVLNWKATLACCIMAKHHLHFLSIHHGVGQKAHFRDCLPWCMRGISGCRPYWWEIPMAIAPGLTDTRLGFLSSRDHDASMESFMAFLTTFFQLFLSQGLSSITVKLLGSPYNY